MVYIYIIKYCIRLMTFGPTQDSGMRTSFLIIILNNSGHEQLSSLFNAQGDSNG